MHASKISLYSVLLSLLLLSCEKDRIVSEKDLPNEVNEYIASHFPENNIVQANLDQETFLKHYEVFLNNNTRLEFNENKNVVEIEGVKQIPENVIPTGILNYVNSNFPNQKIRSWELDNKKQEVELDNEMELIFDLKGQFIKIDD